MYYLPMNPMRGAALAVMTRLDQLGCVTAAFPSPEELSNIYIGDVGTTMPAATTRVT